MKPSLRFAAQYIACACVTLQLIACGPGVAGNAGPQLVAGSSQYADAFTLAGYTSAPRDTTAAGPQYFVARTGSDSAAGTRAAPFQTIARAAAAATAPGTIVWVAPGTYAAALPAVRNRTAIFVSTTWKGAMLVPSSEHDRSSDAGMIGFDTGAD